MTPRNLLADARGAAAIEAAFALPVIIVVMIGLLQFSLVLQASGVVRNAAGEGVRYAKVHPDATEAEVLDKVRAALVGVKSGGIVSLALQRGTATNGAKYSQVTVKYQLDPLIPLGSDVGAIMLNESMSSYQPT
ncbi:TadE/TadG family type IV pilus assembly protein [Novosphingobium album (ex Hu et al. 2023)]|uniref:Pilus assembly protein n=1 Tax=Novosphingobium album (ex Hu et al. 2023) TaxID=2930093 RepID=A0ABT0B0R8_9SPHN|nr:TadE/TadG family type IV pilus assembly protein [Novosphingobium album (ex Hu et al. 2023)]MCJ2178500.1 pilus assembly protein [Novosphingobium album (ex Hu et al. 2023)]